ncbi:MAG: hypothetical protein K6A75_07055 [Ruminococcus sp.]|nr:hypothetical protein [Ruminococcus sp.]
MKKARKLLAMALSLMLFGASAVTPASALAESEMAENVIFKDGYESIFVVVGTYNNKYTQLRCYSPSASGKLSAKKVVMTDTSAEYSYGDILVCSDEPELTEVYPYKNDPVYAHAYHYELSETTHLDTLGNCTEFQNMKELTVTRNDYVGSGYWSFWLTDDEGAEYRYSLNYVGSQYGVDLTKATIGDVYTFAMVKDTPILPLSEAEPAVTTTMKQVSLLSGDANGDFLLTVADPVAVLQHIGNRDKYSLTEQGLINADVDGVAGVTANDARVLQEWDANKCR